MGRRYPPLTPGEVVSILSARGFSLKRQVGSHGHYELTAKPDEDRHRVVTVDMSIPEFDVQLIKSMIRQSGLSREGFYGAIKRTAKKI